MAKIIEVIPFEECRDVELVETWHREVASYDWLFAADTDYFIKAETTAPNGLQYFVRTTDGGWFSMGRWASSLDIDGSLYEKMKEYYNVKE